MMLINILTLLLQLSLINETYSAFIPTAKHACKCTSPFLMMTRPDSSNEIKEALKKSEEFGPNSREAKVAWDIVEEIDASDNIRYKMILR